jgi:hypothetical protein
MGTIYGITIAVIEIIVIPPQAIFNCQNSFNPMLFLHRLRRYIGRYVGIIFYVRFTWELIETDRHQIM